MDSRSLSMIIVAPLCSQKEYLADLLALLVEEPLELPMLWNLLVAEVAASSRLETIKQLYL